MMACEKKDLLTKRNDASFKLMTIIYDLTQFHSSYKLTIHSISLGPSPALLGLTLGGLATEYCMLRSQLPTRALRVVLPRHFD
jgi:hypothetical protein